MALGSGEIIAFKEGRSRSMFVLSFLAVDPFSFEAVPLTAELYGVGSTGAPGDSSSFGRS